jgi:hypothetical protein
MVCTADSMQSVQITVQISSGLADSAKTAEHLKSAIPEWKKLFEYLESLNKKANDSMGVVGEKTEMRPERVAKVETMLIPMWLNCDVANPCQKCGLIDANETAQSYLYSKRFSLCSPFRSRTRTSVLGRSRMRM